MKHGEIVLWGSFWEKILEGLEIKCKMNAVNYREILEDNLIQSARELQFIFRQDNDPKQRAKHREK